MGKLISYAFMRKETDISQNIEDKYLDNPIRLAERQLKFEIGSQFYAELVTQNDTNSFSIANLAFHDPYVKEFIAWQAYQYWLAKTNNYETPTGIRTFKDENSDLASDKSMGELLRIAKQQTDLVKGEMLSFLKSSQSLNASAYPLYRRNCKSSVGGGFHITAISKTDNTYLKIDRERYNNGE
jgi:hypothetical protein